MIINKHRDLKEEWIELKKDIVKTNLDEILWDKVFDIYCNRIKYRYFMPVEVLIKHENSKVGFGFSIVTILCSLIEFLQSSIDGCFDKKSYENEFKIKYKTLSNQGFINYYSYEDDDNEFVKFLIKKIPNANFEAKPIYTKHFKSVAREFYSCIRCSLLHDAVTRNNWIIREKSNNLIFDNSNEKKKILYRNNFYEAIKNVVDEMRNEESEVIRHNLLKKIDVIFETADYQTVEEVPFWWK